MRLATRAFTLIEMMIVLAIMVTVFGLVGSSFSKRNLRQQSVNAAASELAATCRAVRARAMETKTCHAIVFHIQNDPASSGRVLNNRSGGHWYRVIGPRTSKGEVIQTPALETQQGGPYTVAEFRQQLEATWYGDAHILPAKRVRFVALTDMDWGDYTTINTALAGRQKTATRSFPRPWFGWWDAADGRLHGWGGYDPAIAASGFYYWGNPATAQPARDPEPVSSATGLPPGCSNAVGRTLDRWASWVQYNSYNRPADEPDADVLYAAGTPRPLIDAHWMDASLIFLSSGEVMWGDWMPARHSTSFKDSIRTAPGGPWQCGVFERCNGMETTIYNSTMAQASKAEASNFDRDSGGWFITLGPDTIDDRDTFGSAREAMESLMPLTRVFVSSFGEVRVIPVSRTARFGTRSAFPTSEDWWRTGSNVIANFGESRYNTGLIKASENQTGRGPYVGRPITDFLIPDMLANRSVWMK
jgi:prepilin-type N-terminal cleavage/methylation domain-containing protein